MRNAETRFFGVGQQICFVFSCLAYLASYPAPVLAFQHLANDSSRLCQQGSSVDGIARCTTRLFYEPRDWAAYLKRCQLYFENKQFNHAAADCVEASNINPNSWEAYSWEGLSWYAMGQRDKYAVQAFKRALELDQNNENRSVHRSNLNAAETRLAQTNEEIKRRKLLEQQKRADEAARRAAELAQQKRADEAARRAAELAQQKRADEAARRAAELAQQKRADEAARRAAEQEAENQAGSNIILAILVLIGIIVSCILIWFKPSKKGKASAKPNIEGELFDGKNVQKDQSESDDESVIKKETSEIYKGFEIFAIDGGFSSNAAPDKIFKTLASAKSFITLKLERSFYRGVKIKETAEGFVVEGEQRKVLHTMKLAKTYINLIKEVE